MTALNKQARLVSSARISEIANGASLIMGEKEWLANTAIYLANELKIATQAFQAAGFAQLEAEERMEAAEKRIAELQERRKADSVKINDDMAYAFHRAISDSSLGADEVEEIKNGLRAAFANVAAPQPASVVPEAMEPDHDNTYDYVDGWNACRAAMLQGVEPVTQHDELPLDYLQGHKDGLEWAAQLAEANHPQTGDWLYDDPIELAKAIRKGPDMPGGDGNSPAIDIDLASGPDRTVEVRYFSLPGHSVVPIEPTQEMVVAGGDAYVRSEEVNQYPTDAARRIWAAMLQEATKCTK